MGNAITERNQNLSVLNQFSSPFAQTDRFARVNSRKALCPKARDTASSHRYLPLGTFRQRAVRGGCIADYASYFSREELRAPVQTLALSSEKQAGVWNSLLLEQSKFSIIDVATV